MSSTSSTTLRIDVIGKRNGGTRSSRWWSDFLLHDERINSTNTGDKIHDQYLHVNVILRIIQTLEKTRNILHMFVYANSLDEIVSARD